MPPQACTDAFNARRSSDTFGGLVAGCIFFVVEEVFSPDVRRRQVRLDDVGAGQDPLLASRGWIVPRAVVAGEQDDGSIRRHDYQKEQRQLHRSRLFIPDGVS